MNILPKLTVFFVASTVICDLSFGALEPISPIRGETVPLVFEAQKAVMKLPTLKERIAFCAEPAHARGKDYPREARPLVLQLRTTEGENGPWKVLIGMKADLSDAQAFYLPTAAVDAASGRESAAATAKPTVSLVIPRANLRIATRYFWRVEWRGRCGSGCHAGHGCTACSKTAASPVSEFVTEDHAPRWISLEGKVGNIRDFGGRIGLNGRRVRQGLVYRGQGMNDNSITGEHCGRNRLTVEDVRYLRTVLGMRTDLDLRGPGETADLSTSPMGADVNLIIRSSSSYKRIFQPHGMKVMAQNFRVFCNPANYPIYFHCIAGADRTGSLAYIMNCVLGVARHDAETDWELTFYPDLSDANPIPSFWRRESHFTDGLMKYGTESDSWCRRAELYLLDCGVTAEEIAAFRRIMLED